MEGLVIKGRTAEAMPLSKREIEVLRLMIAGKSDREIADTLFISTSTVQTHIDHMERKLEAANRAHLIALALKLHLTEPE